jgi:formate C-acetyltransferase
MTSYAVDDETLEIYLTEIIPFWRGRSIRDPRVSDLPWEWKNLYEAGMFTEFMEQRAAGTYIPGRPLYRTGLLDLQERIRETRAGSRCRESSRLEMDAELQAMDMACEGAMNISRGAHADAARAQAVR